MTDLPTRLRTDAAGLDRLAARYRLTGIDRDGAELGERAGLMRAAADEIERLRQEAPDPYISGLEVTEQICSDKMKQERDAYKEALRPFAREAERIVREWPSMTGTDMQWQIKFRHLDRARALLSQSSEGE